MSAADRADRLPIPSGWPRRVRSAVVHAIGMARAADGPPTVGTPGSG
jgi:hypothetical protein